ncbi:MAG: aspartate carbamoyltransferase [Patescibacteria group bacterium]
MQSQLKHVISADQFLDRTLLDKLFSLAQEMEAHDTNGKYRTALAGKILATVFYEPSTRTRFSFEAGMMKLGGEVLTTESAAQFSSAIKGESIEDSIRIIGGYADAIVLRHPQTGAAKIAAKVSPVPVINAGDGSGEHPTQALLDLYTISKEKKSLDGLHIAMVGDLLYGRTVHSLLKFLPLYKKITLYLVAPAKLQLPQIYLEYLKKHKISFQQLSDFKSILPKLDVLYMTRVQKERFADPNEYEQVKNLYVIDEKNIKAMKKSAMIMHPLPRVTELSPKIDNDPRAWYFRQAQNGLYVRMALLYTLLCR